MRALGLFLVLVSLSFGIATSAQAGPKPWIWGWWPSHWQNLDFQPYLNHQKINQRSLWDQDTWTPEAWIKDAGDARRIVRDFYAVEIVTDQYKDGDDIPVLEVGEAFLQLSNMDQRRVLRFVDHVFEITSAEENGMFYVYYAEVDSEPMGIYNKYGFQAY
ncbi:MAG: hypothetical protein ACRBDL_11160 [Alphaproteobacteria bacterium]